MSMLCKTGRGLKFQRLAFLLRQNRYYLGGVDCQF